MDKSKYMYEEAVPPPGISSDSYDGPNNDMSKADIQPKANIAILQQDTFYEFIAQADKPVLVDFWAMWSSTCTRMISIYEQIAAERDDLIVAKVNVDNNKPLAAEFSIMTIPTLVVFKDGEPVCSNTGGMTKEDILTGIAPFLQ